MEPVARNFEELAQHKKKLGKYLIVREIGKGGMAQVFEARHEDLGAPVAVKVLRPSIVSQSGAVDRFLREARAAAQIRHPNVVAVFDIGVDEGMPFIVMQFLDGVDLATLLANKGSLPVGPLVELFLPIISAISEAHRVGIIHRDLKPSNVMLTSRPPSGVHPFVLDFGISKNAAAEDPGTLTASEQLLGTVHYMAPELTRGAKQATAQSDVYALGVMLYECATGVRPFSGSSPYELMHAIVTAPVIAPRRLQPALPADFDAVVLRAMARDPAERFPSAHAFGSALLSLADGRIWNVWGRAFLGRLEDRDLWLAEPMTSNERAAPSHLLPKAEQKSFATKHRWSLMLMAGGALIALGFVITHVHVPQSASERQSQAAALTDKSGLGQPALVSSSAHLREFGDAPQPQETRSSDSRLDLSTNREHRGVTPNRGVGDRESNPATSANPSTMRTSDPSISGAPKRITEHDEPKTGASWPQLGRNGAPIID